MPTRNRRQFIPQAIESFLSQTWEKKELVILDDGEDPVMDLVPEGIRYIGWTEKLTIPQKRNLVNSLTQGEIIIHWDDDDWSAPDRIAYQVGQLEASGAQLVGYHALPFWDPEKQKAYWYANTKDVYACGTSHCYWRGFWELIRFDERKPIGSDNWFSRCARIRNELWTCETDMMVARHHSGRSNQQNLDGPGVNFRPMDEAKLPEGFPKWAGGLELAS